MQRRCPPSKWIFLNGAAWHCHPAVYCFLLFSVLCPRLLPTLWLRDCLLFNIVIEGHYWTISTPPAVPEGSTPGAGTVFQSERRTAKAGRFMAISQHVHLCSRVLVKSPSTLQVPGSGLSPPSLYARDMTCVDKCVSHNAFHLSCQQRHILQSMDIQVWTPEVRTCVPSIEEKNRHYFVLIHWLDWGGSLCCCQSVLNTKTTSVCVCVTPAWWLCSNNIQQLNLFHFSSI